MKRFYFSKKVISILLMLAVMLSSIAYSNLQVVAVASNKAPASANVTAQSVSSGDTGPQSDIQGSNVLHCFDWSYNSIKANLNDIKAAGYTAVQTSPVQPPKDYSSSWTDQSGQWWKLYQPIDIAVADGNSWLGTKSELKSLCESAEKLGIKVVVDIVANHMANINGDGNKMSDISQQVSSTLRNNSDYWHLNDIWANDDSRYTITQGSIGEPDLNTGNSYIQQRYKSLLVELIGLGVDGFRFDAAKHIELPTDSGCSSQFWPTVINGSQSSTSNNIYYYGEILNTAGTDISNYTKYMSITDNYSGDRALVAANNNNASELANSSYAKGAGASKSVLWVESHDTYMGESGSAGLKCTKSVSDSTIIKAWAIVGARANATSLFFARPATNMGSASTNTTWKSKAVAEVNKFKNYFAGESEYVASSGSVAYVERGTKGVVISNLNGSGSVSLQAHKMADGTYTDQVSGGTFKVSGGTITGNVGSSGVAVVYNATTTPSATITPGTSTYKTNTLTLTLNYTNATSGEYSIDGGTYTKFTNGQTITIGANVAYDTVTTVSVKASDGKTTSTPVSYSYTKVDPSATQTVYFDNKNYKWSSVNAYIYTDNSNNGAWPGQAMTYNSSTGYYELDVDESLSDGYVIFAESSTSSNRYPADMEPGLQLNGKSMLFSTNNSWTEYVKQVATTVAPTTVAPTTVAPTTVKPTVAPTTVAPTTAKPTVAPTTVAPTTAKPTTVAPTTATPTTVAPTTAEPAKLYGDVNLDGVVNISDVSAIQKFAVSMTSLGSIPLILADVDSNNLVNVKDATCIQKYILGISDGVGKTGTDYITVVPTQPTTATPTTQATTVAPTTVKPTVASTTAPTTAKPTVAPTTAPTTAKPTVAPTTVKATTAPASVTIYFDNGDWSGTPVARCFNNDYSQHKDYTMTKVSGTTYKVTVASSYSKVEFRSGDGNTWTQWYNITAETKYGR